MNKFEEQCNIISFFDDCRWLQPENYGLINFADKKFDKKWTKLNGKIIENPKEKDAILLTHLLCYIVDRQMPYRRIWDVCGYIFSKMVNDYIETDMEVNDIIDKYVVPIKIKENNTRERNKKSFIFVCDAKEKNSRLRKYDSNFKEIIKNYEISDINKENQIYIDNKKVWKDNCIFFKSRFYNVDIFSIKRTLEILDNYKRSITYYLSKFIEIADLNNIIDSMAYALDLLSYYKIENIEVNPKNKKSEYYNKLHEKIIFKGENCSSTEYITRELNKLNLNNVFNDERKFHSKRLWCTLRDFLKSKQYYKIFLDNLSNYIEKDKLECLFDYNEKGLYIAESKKYLQLPGDVWNNNKIFRECISMKDGNFPKNLCNYIERIQDKHVVYPEQFDITFDFVPRMCEQDNCDICPIDYCKNPKKEKNNILTLCLKVDNEKIDDKKLCPIALVCCGYKVLCKEMCENNNKKICKLIEILKKNKEQV